MHTNAHVADGQLHRSGKEKTEDHGPVRALLYFNIVLAALGVTCLHNRDADHGLCQLGIGGP